MKNFQLAFSTKTQQRNTRIKSPDAAWEAKSRAAGANAARTNPTSGNEHVK